MGLRRAITEAVVRQAHAAGQTTIEVADNTVITPLARDTARTLGIEFVRPIVSKDVAPGRAVSKAVAIGSDHGGFDYKSDLIPFIRELGYTVVDIGTDSTKSVDYPDFAYAVARTIAEGRAFAGVMIDGAGIGSAIACNKVPGIRAACAYNEFTAWNARAHNDANVLTLGSRTLGIEVCKSIVRVFLEQAFEGGRHAKRVQKISDIETRSSG